VRQSADWVSRSAGGHGAVREAIEWLLRSRKAWPPRN
jgi:3-deoxy-D-manno-octulosonate 8-phosphate phosphatase KdsC-like HAD superfamily phosphatase